MKGPLKERWMNLCEQAVVEQDTQKLMVLIQEIKRLLEEQSAEAAPGSSDPLPKRNRDTRTESMSDIET